MTKDTVEPLPIRYVYAAKTRSYYGGTGTAYVVMDNRQYRRELCDCAKETDAVLICQALNARA